MENLEKAFVEYYQTKKREAIKMSIIFSAFVLLLFQVQWHVASTKWMAILVVGLAVALIWINALIIKFRISKKWFVTNEDDARKFIENAINGEKELDTFSFFALWLGLVGVAVVIYGYLEKHSIGWIIAGTLINFGAQAMLIGKMRLDKNKKAKR